MYDNCCVTKIKTATIELTYCWKWR